jgi:hypothetical protein
VTVTVNRPKTVLFLNFNLTDICIFCFIRSPICRINEHGFNVHQYRINFFIETYVPVVQSSTRQLPQHIGHGGILSRAGSDVAHHLLAEITAELASVLTV